MTTLLSNNYSELVPLIKDNSILSQLKVLKSTSNGNFDLLKKTISLLTCLCDLDNKFASQSNLSNLKEVSKGVVQIMIDPLISDLKKSINRKATLEDENKAQVLSKWWLTFLSLITQTFHIKKNQAQWGSEKKIWFMEEDSKVFQDSLDALERFFHWKMLLLRGALLFGRPGQLFESFIDEKQWNSYYNQIAEMMQNLVERQLKTATFSSEKSQRVTFQINTLTLLKDLVKKKEEVIIQNSVLRGRFDKKAYPTLSHSIIFGWDGGLYALFNSVNEEELSMLLEGGEIPPDCAETWKKNEESRYKIVMAEGPFGKIRLGIALTTNETSLTMKAAGLVSLKKTQSFDDNSKNLDGFRSNVWNDYTLGGIDELICSPATYDMMFIADSSSFLIEGHQKAYTVQEFVPVFDGSKIFQNGEKYYQNWEHQKNYLFWVFRSVSNLLKAGIYMTNLSPANTLYDPVNERGFLINFGGLLKFKSKEELKRCKAKQIKEFMANYADPMILQKKNEETVDLIQNTSYVFGKFIETIALNLDKSQFQFRPHHAILKKLSNDLMLQPDDFEERKARLSIEEGLKILKGIEENEENSFKETSLEIFMKAVYKETKKDLSKFGLNPQMPSEYIPLLAEKRDPDINEIKWSSNDLQEILQKFIQDNALQMKERVIVLSGSSGSGKSTILQLKYLKALEIWKINDPIPLFINLNNEDNLKNRWNLLNTLIKEKINFNVFSGSRQYPVTLFVDGFDEKWTKMNYVQKFLKELGKNPRNRCLICCDSEYIQNDQDLIKWFGSSAGVTKWFIVKWNLEQYSKKFYDKLLNSLEISWDEIFEQIKYKNVLEPFFRTGNMVNLCLEILPEILKEKQKINKRLIYEKYFLKKIEGDLEKKKETREIFQEKLKITQDKKLIEFIMESAQCLACLIHKSGSNKVNNIYSGNGFFERHFYKSTNPCLENKLLEGIIRLLDLNVQFRGTVPNEEITIGFKHNHIKNFFLICAIMKECRDNIQDSKILEDKLIVEDEALVKSVIEFIQEFQEFKQQLKEIVLFSKNQSQNMQQDKRRIIAAANAITILVAGNVGFSGYDLSRIRICGANLNDGMFSMTDFSEADLSGVGLRNCKLDGALFDKTKMAEINLGLYPEISTQSVINSCCFSADGEEIIAGSQDGSIKIWDRSTNKLKMSLGSQKIGVFSKDGKFILTDGIGNMIKLWDPVSGFLLKTFEGHSDSVNSLCFSPDGNLFLSGSSDKTIRLWDRISGSILKCFEGHSESVTSVCFSHDGNHILSGSSDRTAKLWDRTSGSLVKNLSGHKDGVNSVCISPEGNLILTGSKDKTIKLWNRISGALLKTLESHSNSVNSLCFSHDGNLILSGSSDNTIKIWDRVSGSVLKTFDDNLNSINSVCISSDGNFILSGSEDKTIKLWDRISGSLVKTLESHSLSVISVDFSPDGNFMLSGSLDGTVKLWDRTSGSLLKNFEGHSESINSICNSPDGKLILSGSNDKNMILWERISGSLLKKFEGHIDSVNSVCFSPDGDFILSGSRDHNIKLWDRAKMSFLKSFKGHSNSINSVCFSPDGNLILSASDDNSIKLWDKIGSLLKTFEGHSNCVNSVCFRSDGKSFISGSWDNSIKLWDPISGSLLKTFEGHNGSVKSVCFSLDGNNILSGSRDNTIKLWDSTSGSLLNSFSGHFNSVNSVSFSPDSSIILSGASDQTIKLWDRFTECPLKTFEGHASSVNSVSSSIDGNFIVSGSLDNTIKLWDRISGLLLKTFEGHCNSVNSVSFSPDGNHILSGSYDLSIKLWDRISGYLLKTFDGHSNSVNSVCFSPDGNLILSGSSDNTIKLWNQLSGALLKTFEGHSDSVNSVCFSPDGTLVLSASSDATIKLWDRSSGAFLKNFEGHSNSVKSACFSPDGNYVLSASSDKTVKLWDRKISGNLLKTFESHSNDVTSVCFSPEGNMFLSGSVDNSIKLWDRLSGSLLNTFENHNAAVNSLCFSSDGNRFFSGSNDSSVKTWEKISASLKTFKNPSNNFVCSSIFSSNATQLFCKNMQLIQPIGLSINNSNVLLEKNALILAQNPYVTPQNAGPQNVVPQKVIAQNVVPNNPPVIPEQSLTKIPHVHETKGGCKCLLI